MVKYDVFISYKNYDDNGFETKDSEMAESLYWALQEKGYNPFFSKHSIDSVGRSNYIDIINEALEDAKVFVAVGTCKKNLVSKWVKREINMYTSIMMNDDESDRTILSYRSPDCPVKELPANLADLQSFTDETATLRFVAAALKKASGFRNDGSFTQLLFDTDPAEPSDNTRKGLQIGDKLDDRYTVLKLIGQGGTASVYLAIHDRTNKAVVAKAVHQNSSFDVIQSLKAEVDLLIKLNHPAVPHIYDVIESHDLYIIVMDFIEGLCLQNILAEYGAQPENIVIDIAKQLADVLGYLHSLPSPIIYRDVKPANIMLESTGRIKLIDYGTAREYKNMPLRVEDTTNLGTIGYAAPEQFGGMGQTDCRTDIYGLGVTLYHLVTGMSPTEPPYEILPIRQINPELSSGLEYIIQKCTQKDPEQRYQSANELMYDLEHIDQLVKHHSRFSLLGSKKVKEIQLKRVKQKKSTTPEKTTVDRSYPVRSFAIPGSPDAVKIKAPDKPVAVKIIPSEVKPDYGSTTKLKGTAKPNQALDIPAIQHNNAPLSDDTIAKLTALDPVSQKLVIDLIDKLSIND